MKISIIVPVYNVEKYLPKLIESVIEQTYKNFELILVDDGSIDNSYIIMKKYAKMDERIKIFHKENGGPGLARKYGFNKSNGDYLFFVDSDDYLIDKFVLEKIIHIFSNNNIDLLLFNSKRLPDYGVINSPIKKNDFKTGRYNVSELNDCIVEGCLWMKIFKKELFDESFFIDSNNFEDVYTSYKYLNECKHFYYLTEQLYVVNRLDENISLTKNMNIRKVINTVKIIIEISKFSKLEKSVKIMALNYYMYAVQLMFKSKESLKIKLELVKELKKLKKVFKSDAKKLCQEKFKKMAYIYYSVTKIFI